MADGTIELRNLLKLTNFDLFDFDYEFDDLAFKKKLEQNFIDTFFFYEIGSETPDRFKHKFQTKWKTAMAYYNHLHNTTLLEYDPLINYKLTEALEQLSQTDGKNTTAGTLENNRTYTDNTENSSVSESESSDQATTLTESDDTTQSQTTGVTDSENSLYPQTTAVGSGSLSDSGEVTTSSDNTGTSHTEGTATATGSTTADNTTSSEGTNTGLSKDTQSTSQDGETEQVTNTSYEKTIEGLTGYTYQDLIKKERENMVRIGNMLNEEMKSLFILVW